MKLIDKENDLPIGLGGFGEYGLQTLERSWITNVQIEVNLTGQLIVTRAFAR